ncbi:hypothetical protein QTP88_028686 [Uroleucon formosanum]
MAVENIKGDTGTISLLKMYKTINFNSYPLDFEGVSFLSKLFAEYAYNGVPLNKVQNYLNEQMNDSSSVSFDDLDLDPDYGHGQPRSSLARSMPPVRGSFDSDEEYVPAPPESFGTSLQPPVPGTLDSDDDISVDETTSESSDDNYSDTDSWVEDWDNIIDFEFDNSCCGIKLNISESAREFPLEIFTQLWTDEIFEILIESTNKYGENMCRSCRPHRKGARGSTFKPVDLDEIKQN